MNNPGTPDLVTSADRLKIVDGLIMNLVRHRMTIAGQVVAYKMDHNDPIVRSDIEARRINEARELGRLIGLDPEFAASIEHQLIDHSCKVQLGIMEGNNAEFQVLPADLDQRYRQLKTNLGALCSAIAVRYDRSGGVEYPATNAYVEYENGTILNQVAQMSDADRETAVDLGCAVGRVSRLLSPHFTKVYGFDISQRMVSEAWSRSEGEFSNLDFQQQDLEEGIPLPDNSVNLVVMGLGTASDMPNVRAVLKEISRVLKPDGRFVLSFYNRDALMYQDNHITIDGGLSAEINVDEECLTVHLPAHEDEQDGETVLVPGRDYLVYARPYTWGEIETMMTNTSLHIDVYRSYPTIASVIPRSLLTDGRFREQVAKLDTNLEYANSGAYYLIAGKSRY